ncbi:hypothetical protein M422DRAFT_220262 [Sphaerobolus stellatus SS14]|nr:hypothetical protein M422DRAFT_220262 [Sphaerobolus stellatus SS14]
MSTDLSAKTIAYTTGNPYEALFGYSRAVRRGPFIFDTVNVGRAMKDIFGESGAKWTSTMLVGIAFVEEEMMVEVEVDAVAL